MKPNEHFIPVSPKSTPKQQKAAREKLERDTAEFLKQGGKIKELSGA